MGSNLVGVLAHRRGRRPAFLISLLVAGLGSLGTAFPTGLTSLSIWRFVTGMGVGAALNLATTYVGELSPAPQRGRISVKMFMIGIMGQAVTPFVALALVPNFHIGWRLLFAIGALVGLAGVVFALRLPESPRWLIQNGRLKEAEDLVESMERRFDPGNWRHPQHGRRRSPVGARALRRPAATTVQAAAWASCCTDGMASRSWP